MFSNKRSTTRSLCRVPMLMAWEYPENFHEVVASNISQGGMCIESVQRISQDLPLYIKHVGHVPDKLHGNKGEAFIAKVRWIKKRRASYRFDVGIEHMTQCCFIDQISDYCNHILCDMCGNNIESNLHRTEVDLHLCTDCFWNIGTLGKSITQSSIIRFLSGNVF